MINFTVQGKSKITVCELFPTTERPKMDWQWAYRGQGQLKSFDLVLYAFLIMTELDCFAVHNR